MSNTFFDVCYALAWQWLFKRLHNRVMCKQLLSGVESVDPMKMNQGMPPYMVTDTLVFYLEGRYSSYNGICCQSLLHILNGAFCHVFINFT